MRRLLNGVNLSIYLSVEWGYCHQSGLVSMNNSPGECGFPGTRNSNQEKMTLGLPEKRVLLYILKLRRFLQKPNPCILLQAINIVNRATGIILLPVRRCLIKLSFIYFHKKIKKKHLILIFLIRLQRV